MKKSLFISLLFLCNLLPAQNYEFNYKNTPAKNIELEAYLGDNLIKSSYGIYADCVIPKVNFSKRALRSNFFIRKNVPICKRSKNDKKYYFDYDSTEVAGNFPSFLLEEKNEKYVIRFCFMSGSCPRQGRVFKDINKDLIEKNDSVFRALSVAKQINQNNQTFFDTSFQSTMPLQRQIVYLGKSDSVLKFQYSEFTNNTVPIISFDFTIDISDGNIASFKGAVFEVIEATSSTLQYKVIRHFPEQST
jgi:hypothetical protein